MTIRLDDKVHNELSAVARAKGISLSELVRSTLGELLVQKASPDDVERAGRAPVPTGMTTVERHQLALLHRILARLVDGQGVDGDLKYQLERAAILEKGYVAEYDEVFVAIESEMSRRDMGLVMDILDMFTALEWSYSQLIPAERERLGDWAEDTVKFRGFDLNNRREARLLNYARHLIDQGKWENLAVYFDRSHDRGNSHGQTIEIYERMLEEYNPIWRDKIRSRVASGEGALTLSGVEIERVTDVAVHPDNRVPFRSKPDAL